MTKELKNRILENKVLTHDERIEIIKALEIVEEFERAQIITGGRLNGRTYAYKCGLEDEKRKALEQEPKTGHWIWCGGAHKCSNCEEYTCFEDNTRNAPKYCPNCGARMEGEE